MVKAVGQYKKELLKSAAVAIMSASLLGAITCYFFQSEYQSIYIAFALGEGKQISRTYALLEGSCLVLGLTFQNGSVVRSSTLSSKESSPKISIPDECSGEFDVEELQRITLSIHDFDNLFYNNDTDIRYLVTWHRDRIIKVTLAEQNENARQLGTSKSIGRKWNMQTGCIGDPKQEQYRLLIDALKASFNVSVEMFVSTGFWRATDYIWSITREELRPMLHGTGIVSIAFSLDINTQLKYRIIGTSEEDDITGNATASWTGTWGTIKLTHREGEISRVSFSFETMKLIMTINE